MPQQTMNQSRVIDPILSTQARGFRQANLVGTVLFPLAPVPAYGGNVIEFGKEAFRLYNSKRAPGAATKRLDMGYIGRPYAIVPSALEAKVPRELMRDAAQVPGINLATRAVNTVLRALQLEHEVACATLATTLANYPVGNRVTLAGGTRWTQAGSTPVNDVMTGREAIRGNIGMYPNVLLLSARTFRALKTNQDILQRLSTSGTRVVTADLLAEIFEVDRVVIGAATTATGAADTLGDVWGNDAVLAYVAPDGGDLGNNAEEPAYGYTYHIEGMPAVEEPYWDNNARSWIYGVSFDNTPVLAGMAAGYLIKDAGL